VEQVLENGLAVCDDRWSEAIAVGSLIFVERIKNDLGIKAMHRDGVEAGRNDALREPERSVTAGKLELNVGVDKPSRLLLARTDTRHYR
jgi:hypothetical protein